MVIMGRMLIRDVWDVCLRGRMDIRDVWIIRDVCL